MTNRRLYDGPQWLRVLETDAAGTYYPVADDDANERKTTTAGSSSALAATRVALLGYSVMDWDAAATDMTVIIQSHDGSQEYFRIVMASKDSVDRYVPLGVRGRIVAEAGELGFRIVTSGGPAEFVLDYEILAK